MALIPTEPRKQRMLFGAVLFVVGAAAYWNFLWSPAQEKIASMLARADTLDSLNRFAKQEMAAGNAGLIRREGDNYALELDAMRRLVPTANEVPALLESVANAAQLAGLDISEFSPDGVQPGNGFDVYRYKLSVTGPYHQVTAFLANIGSLERIVEPINVTLAVSGRQPATARRNVAYLDAHFDIQTYVARTTPPPAKATATSGAK